MSHLTPAERIFTALSHREADRVPYALTLTLHGAKALGMSLPEYFEKAEQVVEGQLRMQRRFGHDTLMGFLYAAVEYEAWGGEAIFVEDGPPNSGAPVFTRRDALDHLEVPRIEEAPGLQKTLATIRGLKAQVGDAIPILGVVLSPFSTPVMQLGFGPYLELLHEDLPRFWKLMAANQAFAVAWGNAQLEAGATALIYFDPLASPEMIPLESYRETGHRVARQTLAGLKGPVLTHLASSPTLEVLDLLVETGTLGVGVSCREDLRAVKQRCAGRLGVVGNLNGIAMARWTPQEAEEATLEALHKGGPGGGFILADNHGEIPWPVTDEVLGTIAETVRTRGVYPLVDALHA